MNDFFRVSEFLFGEDPWNPREFSGDKQNDLAQQALYAHELAKSSSVKPSEAASLVILRECGMLFQPSQLAQLTANVSETLQHAFRFFYEIEGKIDANGQIRNNLSNSFTLSEVHLAELRANPICKLVLEAELGAFLIRNLWYELFYDYGEFTQKQLDSLVKKSAVADRDKERISLLDKDPTARVLFLESQDEQPRCQFGDCQALAQSSIYCSECPSCEQLCGKHVKQSKNDVWGYWLRFSKSCGHNVEMRNCLDTRLVTVVVS